MSADASNASSSRGVSGLPGPRRGVRRRAVETLASLSKIALPLRIFLDLCAWLAAIFITAVLRREMQIDVVFEQGYLRIVPVVVVLVLLTGTATGLYRRRWRYGSFDEVAALAATAVMVTAGLFALNEFYFGAPRPVAQSVVLVGGLLGLTSMAGIRYAARLSTDRLRRPSVDEAEGLLIFTDGDVGVEVVHALQRTSDSRFAPVGLLDDRPEKRRLVIAGVPVLGGRDDLATASETTGASTLLVAVPDATRELMRDLVDRAMAIDMRVKVLPSVDQSLRSIDANAIRNVSEEDLLGRRQIDTNMSEIAGYLRGRRVLVTGAGGSIGSEICRQVAELGPATLTMLDRDESALHAIQMSLTGRALLDSDDVVLCDLRDRASVRRVFDDQRPDVVFHAAALKHLPLLERFPLEGIAGNVVATKHVLEAAAAVDVDVFVNISSDKAANPTSILGLTKRVAERLTAHVGGAVDGTFLSVRFGNVLGSRGSALVAFREQIARGGPVTVTDADATRFFMTVAEAVQLVIQAGAIGFPGEVLVLDMGEPVRIYDIVRRLIAQSGERIDVVITGLRPGEKLHEELFGEDEADHRPHHPLISHARVPSLDPASVPTFDNADQARRWLGATGGSGRSPERPVTQRAVPANDVGDQ